MLIPGPARITSGTSVSGTSAVILTQEGTSSGTFVDLATPGPSITVTVGASGLVLVVVTAQNAATTTSAEVCGIDVSGANTIAASDDVALISTGSAGSLRCSVAHLYTGLTPGSTTFKMVYHSSGGATNNWLRRELSVVVF